VPPLADFPSFILLLISSGRSGAPARSHRCAAAASGGTRRRSVSDQQYV